MKQKAIGNKRSMEALVWLDGRLDNQFDIAGRQSLSPCPHPVRNSPVAQIPQCSYTGVRRTQADEIDAATLWPVLRMWTKRGRSGPKNMDDCRFVTTKISFRQRLPTAFALDQHNEMAMAVVGIHTFREK